MSAPVISLYSVDQNLKDFPVEPTYLSQLRPRVRAAIELQKLSSQGAKKKSRENWLTKAARELDIELDEEDKEKSSYPIFGILCVASLEKHPPPPPPPG